MDKIEDKVEQTLASLNQINEVTISDTFKNEVLSKIKRTEPEMVFYNWFTPQLQLAAMLVVLLVNTVAIYQLFSAQDSTALENFVEQYDLNSGSFF